MMRLAAVLIVATAALAAPVGWKSDPTHTSLIFRVDHLGFSHVYGRFNKVEAEFTIDEDEPAESRVEFTIAAASVDTGNAARDEHLRKSDFFDVGDHPEITFRSTAVKPLEANRYEVTGDLTLLGVTKPMTVEVTRAATGKTPDGTPRTGFETEFVVKRSEYGMKAAIGFISDEVEVVLSLEATPR